MGSCIFGEGSLGLWLLDWDIGCTRQELSMFPLGLTVSCWLRFWTVDDAG